MGGAGRDCAGLNWTQLRLGKRVRSARDVTSIRWVNKLGLSRLFNPRHMETQLRPTMTADGGVSNSQLGALSVLLQPCRVVRCVASVALMRYLF